MQCNFSVPSSHLYQSRFIPLLIAHSDDADAAVFSVKAKKEQKSSLPASQDKGKDVSSVSVYVFPLRV